MAELSPEIVAFLNGLAARDELDELGKLFEESSQAWRHLPEDERRRLIARAAALMSEKKV